MIYFTDPSDYIGGIQRQIFPSTQTTACALYNIVQDNEIEINESFIVSISVQVPIVSTSSRLGSKVSTTVTIIDASECIYVYR